MFTKTVPIKNKFTKMVSLNYTMIPILIENYINDSYIENNLQKKVYMIYRMGPSCAELFL